MKKQQSRKIAETEPCIGDIESSGLGDRSYPIEIAWSTPEGAVHSWLVRPEHLWIYWDLAAEELHHIAYVDLKQYGKPAREIAEEMNADLNGQVLYFDGGAFDRFWLDKLYEVANLKPAFTMGDFNELLASIGCNTAAKRLAAEAETLKRIGDRRHRAWADVEYLQTYYGYAVQEGLRKRVRTMRD